MPRVGFELTSPLSERAKTAHLLTVKQITSYGICVYRDGVAQSVLRLLRSGRPRNRGSLSSKGKEIFSSPVARLSLGPPDTHCIGF
jgi:hypothetical protein